VKGQRRLNRWLASLRETNHLRQGWGLLCWFGTEKITKSVWAGIFEKWSSWFDDEEECPAISIIRCDGTTATQKYILIRSDRVQDLTEFSE